MVGGALRGEIERHFEAVLPAGRHEAAEIGESSKRGMDCIMPPLRSPDSIETARIIRASLERVIASLAIGMTNRMDRGEINDIESQTSDVRQPGDAIVERAMPTRYAPLAPRDHLVPSPR